MYRPPKEYYVHIISYIVSILHKLYLNSSIGVDEITLRIVLQAINPCGKTAVWQYQSLMSINSFNCGWVFWFLSYPLLMLQMHAHPSILYHLSDLDKEVGLIALYSATHNSKVIVLFVVNLVMFNFELNCN